MKSFIQRNKSKDYCYTPTIDNEGDEFELFDTRSDNSPFKYKYKIVEYKELSQARRESMNFNDIDQIRKLAVQQNIVPGSSIEKSRKSKTTQEEIDLPIPEFIPAVVMDIETSMTIGSPTDYTAPITSVVLSYNNIHGNHYHKVWLNNEIYTDIKIDENILSEKNISLNLYNEKTLIIDIYKHYYFKTIFNYL